MASLGPSRRRGHFPSKKVGYQIPLDGAPLPAFMPCRSGKARWRTENRENNREFVVFSTIWAIVDAKSRSNSKALACNSLFDRIREFSPHEQGKNHRNKKFRLLL